MLERLKKLLGIADDSKDELLQFTIDNVTDMVLNYCNITEVPEKLENIILSMCVDKFHMRFVGEEYPLPAYGSNSPDSSCWPG